MEFIRKVYVLICLSFTVHHVHCQGSHKVKSKEIVDKVNNDPSSLWKAYDYGMEEYDVEEFRKTKLGAILRKKKKNQLTPERMIQLAKVTPSDRDSKLPENFTWADQENTKKNGCPISNIRDQSNCGSCWAVATAAALSDRICIATNGKIKTPLSHQYILSCDESNFGCDGGYMDKVNNFTMNTGVITGGEYESDEGCQPYSIMPCRFPELKPCVYQSAITPKCRAKKCTNEWYPHKTEPDENVFKTKKWRFIVSDRYRTVEQLAQEEIINNGSLTAGFWVTQDFIYYKSGVYVPPARPRYVGGHAVRVVGWGVEKGVKYWHVANSWTKQWGEGGFFKIIRGVNACFFEEEFSVLEPAIQK